MGFVGWLSAVGSAADTAGRLAGDGEDKGWGGL